MKHFLRKKKLFGFLLVIIILLSWKKSQYLNNFFKFNVLNNQAFVDALTPTGDVSYILRQNYNLLANVLVDQSNGLGLSSVTTDETMVPIRGSDWDDNGTWRTLHNHTWVNNHNLIASFWNIYQTIIKNASIVIDSSNSATQITEAKFIRDFAMFTLIDNFNQTTFFLPNNSSNSIADVLNGANGVDFLINDVKSILNTLPVGRGVERASRDAARVLLIKLLLNRAVFKSSPRINFVFDSNDMNDVIKHSDTLINSNVYTLNTNYFNNFAYNNGTSQNSEIIFSLKNDVDISPRIFNSTHYNQAVSGWNGFCALSEFYDKFEKNDFRREQSYSGFSNLSGMKVGFLYGQQYNAAGTVVNDRRGNPLYFTRNAKEIETGSEQEVAGIRILKYVPDYNNGNNNGYSFNNRNHFAVFRYPDVLLMKAEALLRKGNNQNNNILALNILNSIRTHSSRSATAIKKISLDEIINERGRELYTENFRRNDLIRFGKYLNQRWGKNYTSNIKYLLFPISDDNLSNNPNLVQNLGY